MFDATLFDNRRMKANQTRMESERTGFDTLRAEIASMILPNHAHFAGRFQTSQGMGQGQDRTQNLYDEYGALAAEDGVAAFEGFLMPRGQKWQGITLHDETLLKPLEHRQWLERKEKRLFALRNDPMSGFTSNVHDSSTMVMCLGMQSLWVDKRHDGRGRPIGLSYQSEHIDGIWVDRDAEGNILRIHRKIKLTAEQAQAKWGKELPPKVAQALEGSNPQPQKEFEFLHVIERNPRLMDGRIDARGRRWIAGYFSCTDDAMFITGGYRTLRRVTSCFDRASNESYGRGRAMLVIGALRASQLIMQDRVLGTEMSVKRPLLAPDDDLDEGVIDLAPFGITFGGMDERGNPRLRALFDNIDLADAKDLHAEVHAVLDKVFYRDLLQINRELKTHISAARTMEEIAEKGILLAPLARQEEQWFSPQLDVELDLMWEMGEFDDMPPRLAAYFEAGHTLGAVYDNGVSRMQEAGAAAGYLRTAEQVGGLAAFDPDVVPQFRREYPLAKVLPELGRINGIPARWQATDDEKKAQDDADQARAQTEQLLAAAPIVSQSVKNIAQAGALGNGA